MKVILKNNIADIFSFIKHIKKRNKIFRKASRTIVPPGYINRLAKELHPLTQTMIIQSVIDEDANTKTYSLTMEDPLKKPAYFRGGQYISVRFHVQGSTLTRPFSISSTPEESLARGIYQITIKKGDDGFISQYVYKQWKVGNKIHCSGPEGNFYYQPLRDLPHLVCIGGGSGITPFRSLIAEFLKKQTGRLFLFHGSINPEELIFRGYFEELVKQYPQRFVYIPVCSDQTSSWQGEKGFITKDLILAALMNIDHSLELKQCSTFICGPPVMEEFLVEQLKGLPLKNIRKEQFAQNALISHNPVEFNKIKVTMGTEIHEIEARSDETILLALERAGLSPPSLCRSGSCGWCRSRLIKGKMIPNETPSGLREADKVFGYIHPCCEFPAGDMEIDVPVNYNGEIKQ
ncbi:MAG: FAD-binding oxidoreductase [Spirochaetaceae bacterium]|nr:FAD-binding oxidoreductase [Spirochaetaceae bacterium]